MKYWIFVDSTACVLRLANCNLCCSLLTNPLRPGFCQWEVCSRSETVSLSQVAQMTPSRPQYLSRRGFKSLQRAYYCDWWEGPKSLMWLCAPDAQTARTRWRLVWMLSTHSLLLIWGNPHRDWGNPKSHPTWGNSWPSKFSLHQGYWRSAPITLYNGSDLLKDPT